MCKLYVATGAIKRNVAEETIKTAFDVLTRDQKDGFGFVAYGANGQVAYGRYLTAFPGFKSGLPDWLTGDISEIGELPEVVTLLICHARTSTNKIALGNCHPFKRDNLFLAHNGVLEWTGEKGKEPKARHDCDSDRLLTWLNQGGQWADAKGVWCGYGAVAVLDVTSGQMTLAKDGTARLYMARRAHSTGWMMSTDDSDLKRISAGLPIDSLPLRMPRRLVTFDASGQMAADSDWPGFGDRTYDALFAKSYGYHQGIQGGKNSWAKLPLAASSPQELTEKQIAKLVKRQKRRQAAAKKSESIQLDTSGNVTKVDVKFTAFDANSSDPKIVEKIENEIDKQIETNLMRQAFPDWSPGIMG